MPVVSMQPEGQLVGASLRVGVSLGVGPFSEGSLDEALGLTVGLWRIGFGADVLELAIATWTNSQPMPRLLLWPVRSPVMRWPIRSKRPSFLMSIWIISPGALRS